MNLRTLLNTAYAALVEGLDEEGLEKFDGDLDEAAAAYERARDRARGVQVAPRDPVDLARERAERMLRRHRNDPKGMMAIMAAVEATTR